jgi:hypothetical protein
VAPSPCHRHVRAIVSVARPSIRRSRSRAWYFPAPHADTSRCTGTQVRSRALSIVPISIFPGAPAAHPARLFDSGAPASSWIAHAHACAAAPARGRTCGHCTACVLSNLYNPAGTGSHIAAQLELDGGPVNTAQCTASFQLESAQSCRPLSRLRAGLVLRVVCPCAVQRRTPLQHFFPACTDSMRCPCARLF